jgi:hypothetical protein
VPFVFAALAPFPDARKAAIRALNNMDEPRPVKMIEQTQ